MDTAWTIRPYEPELDREKVWKVWVDVSGFDASMGLPSKAAFDSQAEPDSQFLTKDWVVAVTEAGVVVGFLAVAARGSQEAQIWIATNPAWRGRGIGSKLMERTPVGLKLLAESRASASSSSALMAKHQFQEQDRETVMRASLLDVSAKAAKDNVTVTEDIELNPDQFLRELEKINPKERTHFISHDLRRAKSRLFYFMVEGAVQGLVFVAAADHMRVAERNAEKGPRVGAIHSIGLRKSARGKGLSRLLVRQGLIALAESGFEEAEVHVARGREKAEVLYGKEGFKSHDQRLTWVRRDDEVTGNLQVPQYTASEDAASRRLDSYEIEGK